MVGYLVTVHCCLLMGEKPVVYACDRRDKIGLSLKEEVGQMLSGCPSSSNNFSVDSFIICAIRGFINLLMGVPSGLRAK
jgi:hypothetical protein